MRPIFLFTFIPLMVILFGFSPAEPEASSVKWLTLEEAVELSEKDGKKIFIDLYTDWCGWCKKMDRQTFNNPKVANMLNEHFHPVKFNAEQKGEVTLKGRTYKFVSNVGRRGVHEVALRLTNGRPAYPYFAIVDAKLAKLTSIPGYKPAREFFPILGYFAEDAYKTEGWQDFQKQFMVENW